MLSDEELVDMHWPQVGALRRHLEDMTSTPYLLPLGGGSSGGGGNTIIINATTNANAKDIGDEVAWAMRTTGR